MAYYLENLARSPYSPNFWVSTDWWRRNKWEVKTSDGFTFVVDPTGRQVLPSLSHSGEIGPGSYDFSLIGQDIDTHKHEFVDANYILTPLPRTFSPEGKEWRPIRKAYHSIERAFGLIPTLTPVRHEDHAQITDLLMEWAGDRQDIYDPEVMVEYLMEGPRRLVLRAHDSEEVLGILAWDTNLNYINFRYCFVKPGIPYLSEIARMEFRHTVFHSRPFGTGAMAHINDGGDLGNSGLARFKRKLNPTSYPIWSTK